MACEHREEEAVTHLAKSRQIHNYPLFFNYTPTLVEQEKLRETFRKACFFFFPKEHLPKILMIV